MTVPVRVANDPGAEILAGHKLITCYLPADKVGPVNEALENELGIHTGNIGYARGVGTSRRVAFGVWDEIAVLTVVVPADRADAVFAFVFERGEVDRPRGGIVTQQPLEWTTPFRLPDPAAGEG